MLAVFFILAALPIALCIWRYLDHRADRTEMERLLSFQPADPPIFRQSMVADLPEPARRYFAFSIREGTPLYTVAELKMEGKFGLGQRDDPNYLDMKAVQILAAPNGFVWKMAAGAGLKSVSGSDSSSWTRFWLAGLVPVARTGGTEDHARSAFGRCVSEAVFWTPAAVLPRPGVTWDAPDPNIARVTMTHEGMTQTVDITVDADGRPTRVVLERWSNANPDRTYRPQSFGGYLSEFRDIEGFRIPTHVEGGNFIGTDAYFPFFIARLTEARFATAGIPQ